MRSFVFACCALLGLCARAEVSLERRDQIWTLAEKRYGADFLARGLRFRIEEPREKKFLASTDQIQETHEALVFIDLGVRTHKRVTPEIYSLILCHEIGHHLGGAPLFSNSSWASVEGQADDFALRYCLPAFAEKPLEVARSLLQILSDLRGLVPTSLRFGQEDLTVSQTLLEGHGSILCRWTTFQRASSHQSRPACWFPN